MASAEGGRIALSPNLSVQVASRRCAHGGRKSGSKAAQALRQCQPILSALWPPGVRYGWGRSFCGAKPKCLDDAGRRPALLDIGRQIDILVYAGVGRRKRSEVGLGTLE